ncbi:DUF1934 domain-containing protein [Carnobacterium divergens]|uniref:DUF1934 domain-containing protein n=1 Tax=Carnobacterium divergens TaxID=2748 RepID=UPI0039AEE796
MSLKKITPVNIQLSTTITQYEAVENHTFDVMGQATQMGDTLYVRYKEETEGETPVTIKIEPDGTVGLIRAGETRTKLRFGKGERYVTHYTTLQGVVSLETMTNHLQISLMDQPFRGNLEIHYDLYMGKEKLGEYKLQLLFTA